MAESFKITGKFRGLSEIKEGEKNGKAWKSCKLVIDIEDDKYPTNGVFEVFGEDKVKSLESLTFGQEIDVVFNVQGSEYQGKYYGKLSLWKFETKGITNTPPTAHITIPEASEPVADDLPF